MEHRAGISHRNADGLSRIPCKQCGRESICTGAMETGSSKTSGDTQKAQENDLKLEAIIAAKDKGEKPEYHMLDFHSKVVKSLWHEWESLKIKEGKLVRV